MSYQNQLNEWFQEGARAYYQHIDYNPYPPQSDAANEWYAGYEDAMEDHIYDEDIYDEDMFLVDEY